MPSGRRGFDFEFRIAIREEFAAAAFEKTCSDFAREALRCLEIGIPFALAVGRDEAIAEHMLGECQIALQVPASCCFSD